MGQFAPPRSYAKAHGGQGGDLRQPAWLHQGQVLPNQPSGLLRWSDYTSGKGMSSIWIHLKPLTWSPTTSFSLNWGDMDLMGGLLGG